MKSTWKKLLVASLLSLAFLAGCNMNDNNDNNREQETNEQENVDYRPVKYDDETNTDEINEDYMRDEEPGAHNENPNETDMELEKGSHGEFDKNRGAE